MGTTAKRIGLAILLQLDTVKLSELDWNIIGNLAIQIKPWLDLKDGAVESKFNDIMNRKNSSWEEEMSGPAEALCQAVLSIERLIGVKGSLLDVYSACSIDKMFSISQNLSTLGDAYVSLDGMHLAWQKSVDESTPLSDKIKSLAEEAELLLHRGKIILACHSGLLSRGWSSSWLWSW